MGTAQGCTPTCESSAACRESDATAECRVQDDVGVCEAIDANRRATACETVADCDGFPVEAQCQEGVCECPAEVCDGAYSTRLCLCFASDGDVDAVCFADEDCNGAFTCKDNRCTDEPQVGAACARNADCEGGPELFTCINDTCRQLPDDNGVCDDNDDCRIRPTDRCVNGQCHTNAGQPGDRCFGDSDCFTQRCDDDFFCE